MQLLVGFERKMPSRMLKRFTETTYSIKIDENIQKPRIFNRLSNLFKNSNQEIRDESIEESNNYIYLQLLQQKQKYF